MDPVCVINKPRPQQEVLSGHSSFDILPNLLMDLGLLKNAINFHCSYFFPIVSFGACVSCWQLMEFTTEHHVCASGHVGVGSHLHATEGEVTILDF